MSQTDAFKFNTQLRGLKTIAACADLFRSAIAPFGFDTFACGELDLKVRERTVFHIVDWPAQWRRFYLSEGLVERDPLIDALAFRHQPFTWSELRQDKKLQKIGRDVLEKAAAAGWTEGLVVPLSRGNNRIGLVSMVGHDTNIGSEDRAFLCLISICLHGHARSLVRREGFAVPPAGLTGREVQCVRLVAQGFSDNEIAKRLSIAASTAHEFVEKAKHRLKTRTRVEMVAIAAALGIIDF
jgi:LuxR family transcriptional regulator, quorum-sensing system regulator BjaR1